MSSLKLFNEQTSIGESRSVPVETSKSYSTIQASMGGTVVATAVTLDLEGSLDETTWFTLASHVFTASEITAGSAMFHVTNKPVPFVRLNLTTLTGGTTPTITALYCPGA